MQKKKNKEKRNLGDTFKILGKIFRKDVIIVQNISIDKTPYIGRENELRITQKIERGIRKRFVYSTNSINFDSEAILKENSIPTGFISRRNKLNIRYFI